MCYIYVQGLSDFHIYTELLYLILFPLRTMYTMWISTFVSITHMRGYVYLHLVPFWISRGSFHSTMCPVLVLPQWIYPILSLFGDSLLYTFFIARVCISCGS